MTCRSAPHDCGLGYFFYAGTNEDPLGENPAFVRPNSSTTSSCSCRARHSLSSSFAAVPITVTGRHIRINMNTGSNKLLLRTACPWVHSAHDLYCYLHFECRILNEVFFFFYIALFLLNILSEYLSEVMRLKMLWMYFKGCMLYLGSTRTFSPVMIRICQELIADHLNLRRFRQMNRRYWDCWSQTYLKEGNLWAKIRSGACIKRI